MGRVDKEHDMLIREPLVWHPIRNNRCIGDAALTAQNQQS
jgi:hypothetical protein